MHYIVLLLCIILPAAQAFSLQLNSDPDSLMNSLYPGDKPGAAIAVVKDGAIVFKKGYGLAETGSKKPVLSSTNFNICSLTKQFTAFSILKLAGEQKLSLDDKIGKYFPDFIPEISGMVTIRHMLTHSSGIVDHYDFVDRELFKEFRDKDVATVIKSVDSVYFQAGSDYRYSNTAYCLLSLIIEKVSGLSFSEFIRENIFRPLNMDKSDVISPGFRISERAYGYEPEKDSFKLSDANESLFFATQGDGGIYTSVDDYLKWILAVQSGKVIDSRIIKEAQSAQFPIDEKKNLCYGFGWFVSGSGDNKVVYHTGSNGGFRTIIFMVPSKKYSLVIFSNRSGIDLEELVRTINKIYNIDSSDFFRLDSLIS